MPYKNISNLPDSVKHALPKHAQEIYAAAFNHAWEEYKNSSKREGQESREEAAHKVAWAAVKKKYTKSGETWKEK
ncbi:MAG: cation transport regulator ChaB [Alphaproteobacteria bacterium 41-28]|mgnify:CR=1 FL=1|nr:MAG: cation transport regulator ChaB [Alphaproteobacteria bacterium 41-28]